MGTQFLTCSKCLLLGNYGIWSFCILEMVRITSKSQVPLKHRTPSSMGPVVMGQRNLVGLMSSRLMISWWFLKKTAMVLFDVFQRVVKSCQKHFKYNLVCKRYRQIQCTWITDSCSLWILKYEAPSDPQSWTFLNCPIRCWHNRFESIPSSHIKPIHVWYFIIS